MEAEMKTFLALTLAAAAAASCAPADPVATAERAERDEMELAEAISGRVAGEPLSCVNQRDLRGNRSAGEGAIIFEGPGDAIYVNRPPAGCPDMNFGRALQTRTTSNRLCRGDIVTVFDPLNGTTYGACGLGDFVPYRRTS
jgi:hypothetical protein